MNNRHLSLFATVIILTLLTAPVEAHNHAPPRTILIGQGGTQRGKLGSSCWYDGDSRLCGNAPRDFPRLRRMSGDPLRIWLGTDVRPNEFSISYWATRGRQPSDTDRPSPVTSLLVPVTESGVITSYEAYFSLRHARGSHIFLSAFGSWPNQEGPDDDETAVWTFHIRR